MKHERTQQCAVRVGKPGSTKRFRLRTCCIVADYVKPETFLCLRCGQQWNADDFVGQDLDTVTCSNCYGSNVYVIEVRGDDLDAD